MWARHILMNAVFAAPPYTDPIAEPIATVFSSSAFTAAAVWGDVSDVSTADCTVKPVRFTCSRNRESRPARNVAAAVAAASLVLDELLELLLGSDMDVELDADMDPVCCDADDELPLDVHAVVASASATTALPIVVVDLRNGMGVSCVAVRDVLDRSCRRRQRFRIAC